MTYRDVFATADSLAHDQAPSLTLRVGVFGVPKRGNQSAARQSYKLELSHFGSSPKIPTRADQEGLGGVQVTSFLVQSLSTDEDDPCGQAFMEHLPRCC